MAFSVAHATEGCGKAGSKLAQAEGYLAFCLVVAVFLSPLLPALPDPHGMAVTVLVWACSWLFGISGVRRCRGRARVAAAIGLIVLVLHATLILVIVWR